MAPVAGSWLPAVLPARATENEKLICFTLGAPKPAAAVDELNVAVTETRSPGEKGRSGENAVPLPPGWALKLPACRPLREPTAVMLATCAGDAAGKSMFVPAAASGAPGKGSTSRPRCDAGLPRGLEWAASATAAAAAPPVAATQPDTTVNATFTPAPGKPSITAPLPVKPTSRGRQSTRRGRRRLRAPPLARPMTKGTEKPAA